MSILDRKVSYFTKRVKGIKQTVPASNITLREAFEGIKTGGIKWLERGKWKDELDAVKKLPYGSPQQTTLKRWLPFITFSGTFKFHHTEGLLDYNSLIIFDFDDVENVDDKKTQLCADPYTFCIFKSTRGNGLKLLVEVTTPENHLASYLALQNYYEEKYDLKKSVDVSGKDICRNCFIAHDPDIFINENAEVFVLPEILVTPAKAVPAAQKAEPAPIDISQLTPKQKTDLSRIVNIIEQLEKNQQDITSNYSQEWLNIAFALSLFGEAGRPLFHRVSALNPNYNEQDTEAKYTHCSNTRRATFTSPAIFFKIAKDYGVQANNGSRQAAGPDDTESGSSNVPVKKGKKLSNPEIENELYRDEIKVIAEGPFWKKIQELSPKTGKVIDQKINLNYEGLLKFLADNGYAQLMISEPGKPQDFEYIYLHNNRVKVVNHKMIKHFIFRWLTDNDLNDVREMMRRGASKYFTDHILDGVPVMEQLN